MGGQENKRNKNERVNKETKHKDSKVRHYNYKILNHSSVITTNNNDNINGGGRIERNGRRNTTDQNSENVYSGSMVEMGIQSQ